MRRVDVKLKRCRACRQVMARHRTPGGRLEPPTRYAIRKTCSHRCKGLLMLRVRSTSSRVCRQCPELIVRKRYGRYYEPVKLFLKRLWCSSACFVLWLAEDEAHRAEHTARCHAGRRSAERQRARERVCFHGENDLRRCSFCIEIAACVGPVSLIRPRCQWPWWEERAA